MRDFRPDVAFLDIGMPRLSGYEVAELVRAEPWGREVKLIAVTGWGQPDDKLRARSAGFDRHLLKPIDPTEVDRLLDCLKRCSAPEANNSAAAMAAVRPKKMATTLATWRVIAGIADSGG